jgi:4-hydroxy-tetrahydrodipicolinate reductase
MRILLLGYGKMGRTIEKLATERGHEIIGRIDNDNEPRDPFNRENTDVAIEFSQPDAAVGNIKWALSEQIPVISGTTGWLDRKEEIESYCMEKDGTFFYASNFSIGVNLFFRLNSYLASFMNTHEEYTPSLEETHHTEKKDAPSGTAITLAQGIIENMDRIREYVKGNPSIQSELGIKSLRQDDVPGTHVVRYESEEDTIEIVHRAHSRKGFALGAVMVAEWIKDKKGILTMDDFMSK